jgi:hypothetical protein
VVRYMESSSYKRSFKLNSITHYRCSCRLGVFFAGGSSSYDTDDYYSASRGKGKGGKGVSSDDEDGFFDEFKWVYVVMGVSHASCL